MGFAISELFDTDSLIVGIGVKKSEIPLGPLTSLGEWKLIHLVQVGISKTFPNRVVVSQI
jgi:hypothetical protein